MLKSKKSLLFLIPILAAGLISCSKSKTVTVDTYLIENPGEKQVKYVPSGKIKRGEFVSVKEEKTVGTKKFLLVQIEGVDTKGWMDAQYCKDGKLKSVTIVRDCDLFLRPNDKSDKVGRVKGGQIAFLLEQKGDFMKIQYPGVEAYVQKANAGEGSLVVKTVTIPGLGSAVLSASSQFLPGEGREMEFDPRNLFDGSLQTAWAEGKTGEDGIGEYVSLSFENTVTITEISVVNGWTKSESLYKLNNRVATLKVVTDTGQTANLELMDNNYDYQPVQVNLTGSTFKFIIDKVYKGKDSDTCISEIKLQGSGQGGTAPMSPEG